MSDTGEIIYFDNAATSRPKPAETFEAIVKYNDTVGSSPGRSGHRLSIEAGRIVYETREALAELFNVPDPLSIVFTSNATESLNQSIFGLLETDDHVITSSMEHNSVMRPLREMESRGTGITVVPCSSEGVLDPDDIKSHIKKNTRAIFLTHASNVTGTVMPVREIGQIAKEHGLIFCVDAAQTAGARVIDVQHMNIDLLAFTGHKSLFGPQGSGGLYIDEKLQGAMRPLTFGGTGSGSEFEVQPAFMPDMLESGTPNTPGIAGLYAGLAYINKTGIDAIKMKEVRLTRQFLNGAASIEGIEIYGTAVSEIDCRGPVVSFNIEGYSPSEISYELDEVYGIMSRPGLHCAPSAHKTIGSFPEGTVRFSFGFFNTEKQIQYTLGVLEKIINEGLKGGQ